MTFDRCFAGAVSLAFAVVAGGCSADQPSLTAPTALATEAAPATLAIPLIDLGTLGGLSSAAAAINDGGVVVGNSETAPGTTHAFLWTRAAGMQDLASRVGEGAYVLQMNNRGDLAGVAAPRDSYWGATYWPAAGGEIDVGFGVGRPTGLSNRGEVVGQINFPHRRQRPGYWSSRTGTLDVGLPKVLPGFDCCGYATAINDAGQVVGVSMTSITDDGAYRHVAFSWSAHEGARQLQSPDYLTSLGATPITPYVVTNDGRVYGIALDKDIVDHIVQWDSRGRVSELFSRQGSFSAFTLTGGNSRGELVGYYYPDLYGASRAFVLSPTLGFVDLASDDSPSEARGINERGEIIGSVTVGGVRHAVLWTLPGSNVALSE